MRYGTEASLAILNGAIGDYLARTGNPLATELQLLAEVGGRGPLDPARWPPAARAADGGVRVVVLVHGLMSAETIWTMSGGGDYGARLARDLGFSPVYVRYNTGLAIADNGAKLSAALASLIDAPAAPVREIVLVGHSMGGLVARSACHAAAADGSRWLGLVTRAIYLGTPHLGSPLERVGRVVSGLLRAIDDPYTRLVSEIADLRSDGVKDLGYADLRHEDRARARRWALSDPRHPVPLLPGIAHYLAAGAVSATPWLRAVFGAALVSVGSATAGREGAALPPSHVRIFPGVRHMVLARSPAVYEAVRAWCAGEEQERRR